MSQISCKEPSFSTQGVCPLNFSSSELRALELAHIATPSCLWLPPLGCDATPGHLAQAAAAQRERHARERPCGLATRAEAAESNPSPHGASEAARCTAASRHSFDAARVGPEGARGEPRRRLCRRSALHHWPRPLGGAPSHLHRQALVRLQQRMQRTLAENAGCMQCARSRHAVYARCV